MVKCADCGFLALRVFSTARLEEADYWYRTTGIAWRPHDDDSFFPPICFAREINFVEAIQESVARREGADLRETLERGMFAKAEDTQPVVQQERECDSFTPWKQGFSPKEHREMLDRQWMRDQEEARADADRKWRNDQRREERIWRVIEILAFGVLVSITAIAAGAVGAGWEPSWWPF